MREILATDLSDWEECLLATAYLAKEQLPLAALTSESSERIKIAAAKLSSLPEIWAVQLALAVVDHNLPGAGS